MRVADEAGRLKWAGVAVAWVGLAGGVGWLATRSPDTPPAAAETPEVVWATLPPVQDPPTVAAAAATIPDDSPVLGVAAGGHFRAYPLAALSTLRTHVVNDHLGGQPVAVTYCDRNECTRVFAASARLAVAGWAEPAGRLGGTLLVRDGGRVFRQDTGMRLDGAADRLAYPQVPAVRTTWGAWRAEHPDTDLSLGG